MGSHPLFRLGHGFKFANCKRLPGRVPASLIHAISPLLKPGACDKHFSKWAFVIPWTDSTQQNLDLGMGQN